VRWWLWEKLWDGRRQLGRETAVRHRPILLRYRNIVPNLREITFQARAVWKRFTSTFKSEWTVEDYPLNVKAHSLSESLQTSRPKPHPWTATIINWPGMSGGGDSRPEALQELRKTFERFKAEKKQLPRPGTKVPIQFATSARVGRHADLAKEFVQKVLEIEWAWISDESSLDDFHGDESNKKLIEKIRMVYGVDVSDIPDGNLADIFDRISEKSARNG
jgi:hypothetical protein